MNSLRYIMGRNIVILLFMLFANNLNAQGQLSVMDITVLEKPADKMMREYLTRIVDRQFFIRDSLLSTLKSTKDWDDRAKIIRDSLRSWTGPFPERTPLNARITGRLEREEYVVEKILFESRPGFPVSANLYLPKKNHFPRPAILNVVGHDDSGKAAEKTQRICIAQARKGFVSMVIDGLGQGERKIYDVSVGIAHQIIGTQAFISGTHVFNFMVWDVIRAIDYLVSRTEVDPGNIGITGSSGGGMMSTYILPFDERIKISIPACNPNTWSYRVHANLATDHEQIFFGAFAAAIDPRGDPLFAQVPLPLLINATTDDQLNPSRGVWDLSSWLYKSYAAHGVPEKFSTSMIKAAHEYNREQREVTYSWMLRWTGGDSENFIEENTAVENAEDLWVSNTGSVYNASDSRHPHEWVLDYLAEHNASPELINTQKSLKRHKEETGNSIQNVLNANFDDITVVEKFKKANSVEDIAIYNFVLEPEAGILLPGVLFEPKVNNLRREVVLYINQEGKSAILRDIDMVKKLLKEGYRICAVDLRGTGETSPDLKDKFWDFLAGKPIFSQRVRDVLCITQWLKESEIKANKIKFWGTGMGSLYGAFAGVLSDDISDFVFEEPLLSFESVIQVSVPEYRNEVMLPGILEKFDMTQVYQALCPRQVCVFNPQLADKTPAIEVDMAPINRIVSMTYKTIGNPKLWQIVKLNHDNRAKIILDKLIDD